ncbi:MAG: hypothetical protein M0R66_03275 [Candidatus Omnitrophica bacterium]|nr:hypothetical protein [Candidatus Omnitrophota bacterium]
MRNNKAQSTLEYVALVAAVVAAIIAMYALINYSVMGKFKQSADAIGQGEQYEPGVTQVK